MQDVQHIEYHRYNKETLEKYKNWDKYAYDGIKIIMKSTRYNIELDDWDNNIYLSADEWKVFLKSFCNYRSELEWIINI